MAICIVFILSVILFQTSCATAQNEKNQNIEKENNANISTTPQKKDELTRENIADVSKLFARYKSATDENRKTFEIVFYEAQRNFRAEKFTLSGEGFLESVLIFPTAEGLFYAAESISRLDVGEHPQKERITYKTAQFEEASVFYRTALEFAEKSNQKEELRKFPEIQERIDCLKLYLSDKKLAPCEFVRKILTKNGIS